MSRGVTDMEPPARRCNARKPIPGGSRLLVLLVLLAMAGAAQAHDPGLSRLELSIGRAAVDAELVLARRDLDALVVLDSNGDGLVSAAELEAGRAALVETARSWVALGPPGAPMQVISVDMDRSDGLHFRLHAQRPAGTTLTVRCNALAQLARGHRQYLRVTGPSGATLAEVLLDAGAPAYSLSVRTPHSGRVLADYLRAGIWHIWIGYDHILFLVSLLLPAVLIHRDRRWQPTPDFVTTLLDVTRIVTAFTLAHSLTLALAVLGWVSLPPRLVEPLIALSVLVTALNNLKPIVTGSRWLVAFGFGLIHGFGFAGALTEIGVARDTLILGLFCFNAGVEVGQLGIVALLLPLAYLARTRPFYEPLVLRIGSLLTGALASLWIVERVWSLQILGV
jgi:HupE / UreJ protein